MELGFVIWGWECARTHRIERHLLFTRYQRGSAASHDALVCSMSLGVCASQRTSLHNPLYFFITASATLHGVVEAEMAGGSALWLARHLQTADCMIHTAVTAC